MTVLFQHLIWLKIIFRPEKLQIFKKNAMTDVTDVNAIEFKNLFFKKCLLFAKLLAKNSNFNFKFKWLPWIGKVSTKQMINIFCKLPRYTATTKRNGMSAINREATVVFFFKLKFNCTGMHYRNNSRTLITRVDKLM